MSCLGRNTANCRKFSLVTMKIRHYSDTLVSCITHSFNSLSSYWELAGDCCCQGEDFVQSDAVASASLLQRRQFATKKRRLHRSEQRATSAPQQRTHDKRSQCWKRQYWTGSLLCSQLTSLMLARLLVFTGFFSRYCLMLHPSSALTLMFGRASGLQDYSHQQHV